MLHYIRDTESRWVHSYSQSNADLQVKEKNIISRHWSIKCTAKHYMYSKYYVILAHWSWLYAASYTITRTPTHFINSKMLKLFQWKTTVVFIYTVSTFLFFWFITKSLYIFPYIDLWLCVLSLCVIQVHKENCENGEDEDKKENSPMEGEKKQRTEKVHLFEGD